MATRVLRGPFTVETYQRLAEMGVLPGDARVELIEGQVVEMSPIGDRHAACVRRLNRLLAHTLHDLALIDVQNPVVLGARSAPQPDVVVLKLREDAYPRHPRGRDVLVVVEVADTTLVYDREIKVPLYARAGVPETWLVGLAADQIEVYRDPVGGGYAGVRTVSRGDTITLLHFPHVTLAVDDILAP